MTDIQIVFFDIANVINHLILDFEGAREFHA